MCLAQPRPPTGTVLPAYRLARRSSFRKDGLSGSVATFRRLENLLGPPPRLNPRGQKRLRVQRGILGHCRAPVRGEGRCVSD
jgi:hypothetical protein